MVMKILAGGFGVFILTLTVMPDPQLASSHPRIAQGLASHFRELYIMECLRLTQW
jgi:hypothetical protein